MSNDQNIAEAVRHQCQNMHESAHTRHVSEAFCHTIFVIMCHLHCAGACMHINSKVSAFDLPDPQLTSVDP